MSTYGEYVAGMRRKRRITQRALGKALGVTHVYIGEVERGKRPVFADRHEDILASTLLMTDHDRAALRVLAAVARGTVDVRGLSEEAVGRVLRAIERERARAKGEEAGE